MLHQTARPDDGGRGVTEFLTDTCEVRGDANVERIPQGRLLQCLLRTPAISLQQRVLRDAPLFACSTRVAGASGRNRSTFAARLHGRRQRGIEWKPERRAPRGRLGIRGPCEYEQTRNGPRCIGETPGVQRLHFDVTSICEVPNRAPLVAVMTAVPRVTAVTTPEGDTVATAALLVV